MGWTRAKSRHDVPNVPGVYAVFCGGSLVYIGSSMTMRQRLSSHASKWSKLGRVMKTASIRFRIYRWRGEHLAAEMRLIERLCPKENKRRAKQTLHECIEETEAIRSDRMEERPQKPKRIPNEHVTKIKGLTVGGSLSVPPVAANAAYCGARYFALGKPIRFSSTKIKTPEGEWTHTVIKRTA